MDAQDFFFNIVENPSNPKAYKDLAHYYESTGRTNEGSAILYLIQKKFSKDEDNHPNSSEKQ
jgi:hypothetical protein